MATEPDFFVKQGDFQFLAAGQPMRFYRDTAKARTDWEAGWRDLFLGSFPGSVNAIDAALGFTPGAEAGADEAGDDDGEGEDGAEPG